MISPSEDLEDLFIPLVSRKIFLECISSTRDLSRPHTAEMVGAILMIELLGVDAVSKRISQQELALQEEKSTSEDSEYHNTAGTCQIR